MSDDLDDLKAAMDAATPAPDPAQKVAHLALAQKNFEHLQGSKDDKRLTSVAPRWGAFTGVAKMFSNFSVFSTKGALSATTALAAVGLFVFVPQWGQSPEVDPSVRPSVRPSVSPSAGPSVGLPQAQVPGLKEAPAVAPKLGSEMAETESDNASPAAESLAQSGLGFADADTGALVGRVQPGASLPAQAPAPEVRIQSSEAPRTRLAQPVNDWVQPTEAADTEAYPESEPNPLKITTETPVSTFSIDVDTAAYAIIRSSLMGGYLPPEGAVRIEEMINYFPYDYTAPNADGHPFRPTVNVIATPWNPNTQLVHIAIQGRNPVIENRPPLNLVFLIDTSGSMQSANKLELLKQSLALMLPKLNDQDQVAIVAYAGSAGQVLAPTKATDRTAILGALNNLSAGGSTAGKQGLQQAYSVAESMNEEGEVTRVILATDGDFNVGLSDPEALKKYIANKRDSGTYLSVMGFGRGNLDDATMQALAQNGNGQAAYIDTLSEAQKVLVDQFTGALFPIANDVKIQVEFNPATIAEYRLIGYETRILRREDFNNDKVDAGDIGAGHSVTALYEVTPVGSPAQLSDPLRYQPAEVAAESDELGFLKLRYKQPGAAESQLIELPIRAQGEASADMRFSVAIAGFGQLLLDSPYLGDWGYDQAITLANAAKGDDAFGYRAEAVRLMRLAQSLSQ
ncbi:MAG: von Willebrand factor type A domain-containing protein [Rhodobacteraceae bacterium]|nr:von Willebrand factor type A domain-containing protein [Paracoccaceae bacterium]